MNGKKAKLLRKLAGVNNKDTVKREYGINDKQTRIKKLLDPNNLGTNGKPVVIKEYRTVTCVLTNGARKLNKVLKAQYLGAQRSGTGMLA